MHPEFSPTCVFASVIDETNGFTTWSPEGCELKEVNSLDNTVVCQCNHLSRFTAGEDLLTTVTAPEVVAEEEEDEGSNTKFPIMILFLGILLLAIIITAISEKVRKR